ncbi:MAG: hypothetical protein RRY40_02290 [Oscillospiraceae bacterium]
MKIARGFLALLLFLGMFNVIGAESRPRPYISPDEIYVAKGENAVLCEIYRGALKQAVPPDSVVLFPIENAFRAEDLAGLRGLIGDFEMGQEFLGKPNIEYRMLYAEDNITALGYRYAVALPVLGLAGETKATVKGRVAVGKRWSGSKKVNFAFTIRKDGENPDAESYICDGSEFPVEFSSTTRQVSLIFGADALFDVNAQNQQPLNVGISNTPFTDYALKYPDIKLKFVIFTHNPIFDRRGILSIFAPSGSFLYEITPNGPLLRENLYDEEKKAFVINTHRLGEYVVTDKKLPIGRKLGRVENPPTGKNA